MRFEILLNSIVCFLQFSSSYIQDGVIIKAVVFTQFYGSKYPICWIIKVIKQGIFSILWVSIWWWLTVYVNYLGCTSGIGVRNDGRPCNLPSSCPPPIMKVIIPHMTPNIKFWLLKNTTVKQWSIGGILFHTNSVK